MTHIQKIRELDSFFTSRILLALAKDHSLKVIKELNENGFTDLKTIHSFQDIKRLSDFSRCDLLIIEHSFAFSEELISKFRNQNSDAEIVLITNNDYPLNKQLMLDISTILQFPYKKDMLLKSVKKALGRKIDHDIGMQFFDALFGMQICTHRDMHQRTFDHAIRTTKIYGGFLLFLMDEETINLTSWNLKNCLMASLVHDIGKLLLLQGILYKEGRLTNFEYEQVKRHPWYSVTALLGGQDISQYIQKGPIETVSGYNEKNLSEQVKNWVFSILKGSKTAFSELNSFFDDMIDKPFIHSLNKDLLYIVFRHHDSIDRSYHETDDIKLFSQIIDREVDTSLNPESYLDIVTNALAISDMFDALLDKERNYRKNPYNKSFALYLIFVESKQGRFFDFLAEEFIEYIVSYELQPSENIFSANNHPKETYETIKRIDASFKIHHGQEEEFNRFLVDNYESIHSITHSTPDDTIVELNEQWSEYYQKTHYSLIQAFMKKLNAANLTDKSIADLSSSEIKVFDILFQFYYSFPSKSKQDRIIDYFIDTVTDKNISEDTLSRITSLLNDRKPKTVNELKNLLYTGGLKRNDIFESFKHHDEDLLLTEFNQGIRHFSWSL